MPFFHVVLDKAVPLQQEDQLHGMPVVPYQMASVPDAHRLCHGLLRAGQSGSQNWFSALRISAIGPITVWLYLCYLEIEGPASRRAVLMARVHDESLAASVPLADVVSLEAVNRFRAIAPWVQDPVFCDWRTLLAGCCDEGVDMWIARIRTAHHTWLDQINIRNAGHRE